MEVGKSQLGVASETEAILQSADNQYSADPVEFQPEREFTNIDVNFIVTTDCYIFLSCYLYISKGSCNKNGHFSRSAGSASSAGSAVPWSAVP